MSVQITRDWQEVSGTFPWLYISAREHPLHTGGPDRFIELRKRIATEQPTASDTGDPLLVNSIPKLMSVRGGRLWLKTMERNSQQSVVVELAVTAPPFAPVDSPDFIGNPTAPTPPLGDNDTSIATTAFVQSELQADFPSVEDWRGTSGDTTDTGTLLAAIAAAKAVGGMRLRMAARTYTIEQTLLIDSNHVSLIGEGGGFLRSSVAVMRAAARTVVAWNGAVGGTMVKFQTPTLMERQIGGGLQGLMLDGMDFRAARGLHILSWVWGYFRDVMVLACSDSHIRFETVNYALLPAQPTADTQYNLLEHIYVTSTGSNATAYTTNTAIGFHLTGGSPINAGNTSGNTFIDCHAKTSKGLSWKLENCDDNYFYFAGGGPTYDNAQYCLELGSVDQDSTSLTQAAGPGASRFNMFLGSGFAAAAGVIARSSQTGGNSSRGNQFFGYSRSNTVPLPTIETPAGGSDAATIHYWDTSGNIRINSLAILEKDIAAPAVITDHSQLWIDGPVGPLKLRDSAGTVRALIDSGDIGAWTPAFSFVTPGDSVITHTVQLGKYAKFGDFVFLMLDIEFNTNAYTTASGVAQVTGLPYPSSVIEGSMTAVLSNVTFTTSQELRLTIPASGSAIFLKQVTSNAAVANIGTTAIPASKTAVRIKGTGMYWTADPLSLLRDALADRLEDRIDDEAEAKPADAEMVGHA